MDSSDTMTGPIYLNITEPRKHLLEHGYVYTCRQERTTGLTEALQVSYMTDPIILGNVEVEHAKLITWPSELNPYVYSSGFKDVKEWVKRIKGGLPAHLYKVTLIRGEKK